MAIRFDGALGALRSRRLLRTLGTIVSLAIVIVCGIFFFRILNALSYDEVMAALGRFSVAQVAAAAFFVLCAYGTLTAYDWFALRTLGIRHIPYPVGALAGTTSYAIGHNVGAIAVTAAAVRYRIYRTRGLTFIDVVKICFITGLTFWLGNIAALGTGMVLRPEAAAAVDHLPVWLNRALGTAALVGLAGYIAWVWAKPRRFGRDGWLVTLPDGRRTLIQVGIGIVDLTCCSMAMYMLLPDEPAIDPLSLSIIVISATLLGFLSHAPGSLGVFDVAIIVALPQFPDEQLVATLLVFRILYYLIPGTLAVIAVGLFPWLDRKRAEAASAG